MQEITLSERSDSHNDVARHPVGDSRLTRSAARADESRARLYLGYPENTRCITRGRITECAPYRGISLLAAVIPRWFSVVAGPGAQHDGDHQASRSTGHQPTDRAMPQGRS